LREEVQPDGEEADEEGPQPRGEAGMAQAQGEGEAVKRRSASRVARATRKTMKKRARRATQKGRSLSAFDKLIRG